MPSAWKLVQMRDPRREALERPLDHLLRLAGRRTRPRARRLPVVEVDALVRLDRHLPLSSSAARPRSARRPMRSSSSSLVRSQNAWKASSRSRVRPASRRPAARPSSSASSVGTRRKSGRPIAALAGRARRAGRSRTPRLGARRRSSRAVVPWRPMSPTQWWAQACGQPSTPSCRPSTSSPKRVLEALDDLVAASSSSRPPRSCRAARRCRRSLAPRMRLTSSGKPISRELGDDLVDPRLGHVRSG